MATDSKDMNTVAQKNLPWYRKTGWIIALLIFFWPVGLYLMWKYTKWSTVIKWVVTVVLVIAGISTLSQMMNPKPILAIDNVKSGRVDTDNSKYTVTGSVGSVADGVKVLINDKEALWSGDKFSLDVELDEGDNQITAKAIRGDQSDEEKFIIHRATAAELSAKKEAAAAEEAKKKEVAANEEAKRKATEKAEAEEAARVNAPAEYKSALNQADGYANRMHMSKKGLYDQLVSEYGGQFSAEAAQYAIDNVVADWNANALQKAKDYQDRMSMSPAAIHDQLTSSYGEQFTVAEADYAIKNLNR